MTDVILENISDGVFTIDADWRVTSFNKAAERITGIHRSDAIGKICHEVFKSSLCEDECPLRRTVRTGESVVDRRGYYTDFLGRHIPISVSTALLVDGEGKPVGGAETFRDLREIEELKARLHERNAAEAVSPPVNTDIRTLKKDAERRLISETLARCAYKASVVAAVLKIDKATLYRKMKAYGIPLPRSEAKDRAKK
jgi:PAS domain S-box-containing protein